ncbi:MAG: hypothetical protein AVDCRST_MAG42-3072 [uncultured Chthoniobacterales bacterium]|uniref:Uncharacterized protein n=1 Tax=uncultured Chthoniobacterales bacterium TaxID=1836801 RepID=A0A6J4J4A8_9BACT|nr:MAG: hypothetical protein AVDCRST_MAG42-3072 [uncultured Chthoniobacterales bacterium]
MWISPARGLQSAGVSYTTQRRHAESGCRMRRGPQKLDCPAPSESGLHLRLKKQ